MTIILFIWSRNGFEEVEKDGNDKKLWLVELRKREREVKETSESF